jgi:hypothetical protein
VQALLPLPANVRFLAGYRREALIEESLIPEVLARAQASATFVGVERAVLRSAMVNH